MLLQSLHIHSQLLVLAYLEGFLRLLSQEISNGLIVNLHHADHHFKGNVLVWVVSHLPKHLVTYNGYDTSISSVANHRIGLARACLPVREQATIVSFPAYNNVHQALTSMSAPMAWYTRI